MMSPGACSRRGDQPSTTCRRCVIVGHPGVTAMGTRSANGLACFRRLLSDGHASEAVDGLREWLGLRPNDAEAWKILAAALFELEDWPAASDAARRVTELRPGNARDWCNLGTVLRKLGDHHGAERAQRLALDLDPTYHRATSELTKLGRGSRAEPHRGASEGVMTTGTHRSLTRGTPHDTQPVPRGFHGRRDSRGWLRLVGGTALVLLVLGSAVVGGLRHEAAVEARSREEKLQQEADARRQRELAELARRRAAEIQAARRFEIEQQMMRNTIEYLDSFQSTGGGC